MHTSDHCAVLSFQQVEIWLSFYPQVQHTWGLEAITMSERFQNQQRASEVHGATEFIRCQFGENRSSQLSAGRRHHELEAKLFSAPLRWWLARGHCGRNEGGAANGRAIGWTILMLEYVGIGTKNYHELSTSSNININMSICISYVFASTWEVGLTQLPRAYTAAKGLRSLVMIYCTLVSKRSRRCKSNPWPWELP